MVDPAMTCLQTSVARRLFTALRNVFFNCYTTNGASRPVQIVVFLCLPTLFLLLSTPAFIGDGRRPPPSRDCVLDSGRLLQLSPNVSLTFEVLLPAPVELFASMTMHYLDLNVSRTIHQTALCRLKNVLIGCLTSKARRCRYDGDDDPSRSPNVETARRLLHTLHRLVACGGGKHSTTTPYRAVRRLVDLIPVFAQSDD